MEAFDAYLAAIVPDSHRNRVKELFAWIRKEYPSLKPELKWNQPMFTAHGTFIIGFSVSKTHLAVSPEKACLDRFADDIAKAGYSSGKQIFRIKWEDAVDHALFKTLIDFNLFDKADITTFWRP